MKIDKYIAELTKLRQAHGPDLEITRRTGEFHGVLRKAPLPRIAHTKKGTKAPFTSNDRDADKGEKVVCV
jgi:hypothetical protein